MIIKIILGYYLLFTTQRRYEILHFRENPSFTIGEVPRARTL